jgi:hypothetical protein
MRKTFAIAGVFLSLSLSAYAEEGLGALGKGAAGGGAAGAAGGRADGGAHIDVLGPGLMVPNNPRVHPLQKPPLIKPTTTKPVTSGSSHQTGRK